MATLREEYEDFKRKVEDRYRDLISIQDYDFSKKALDEYDGENKNDVTKYLENGDYVTLCEYDFQEFLTQVYYNDRNMDERLAYLISAHKVGGLYVLDADTYNTFFISYLDLSSTYYKITVIEEIENLE